MADLRLARASGFSFNGVTVDNSSDIVLIDVQRNATPNKEDYRQIDLLVGIYAKNQKDRRIIQRQFLQRIVGISGRLSFLDEPNMYYEAITNGEVIVVEGDVYTEITIPFKASKYIYDSSNNLKNLDVTSNTTINVVNGGNYPAYPIITLTGSATSVSITSNNEGFTLTGLTNETIILDSENMIVYSYSDGKKVSKLHKFRGKFPLISVGASALRIEGTGMNLKVSIDFRNTYIV